tara:strand:- start:48 stop:326 length:279 start_codon:yes stop_codon:yes gene_type:complete
MAIHNINLTEAEEKSLSYVTANTLGWIENAAKERARIAKEKIISILLAHCNANNISLATGENAQVQQAFDLGIVKTAEQRNAEIDEHADNGV